MVSIPPLTDTQTPSPSDTISPGHYEAKQWQEGSRTFEPNADMGIYISVDEVFDNDHRIVSQRGSAKGRFTFSAADSGDHRICFTPTNVPSTQAWLSSGQSAGNIRFELDMAIGETSAIESADKGKIQDIVSKVKDLNARLQDIRREQVFQRVSSPIQYHKHNKGRKANVLQNRNARPSSEISPSPQTLVLSAGLLSSWSS